MPHITPLEYAIASAFGAVVIIIWRIKEGQSAVTLKKIVIPPMGMATGFSMFLFPIFGIPISIRHIRQFPGELSFG